MPHVPTQLLHPDINPNKALTLPPERSDFESFPTYTNSQLKSKLASLCENNSDRELIQQSLDKHIGRNATYTQKIILIKQLSIIVHVLTSATLLKKFHISPSRISSLMAFVLSDIMRCTPGFHDRIQQAVHSLSLPQSAAELLHEYRRTLIDDAFNLDEKHAPTNREVHTNNQFYRLAATLGYGVSSNEADAYSGAKSYEVITAVLAKTFTTYYTPRHIAVSLFKNLLTTILDSTLATEEDIAASRDLACTMLGRILEDPSIGIYDVFEVDIHPYQVNGINWVNIISRTIDYLEENEFFIPQTTRRAIKLSPTLTLEQNSQNPDESVIQFKSTGSMGQPITLKGYLLAPLEMNLFNILPTADKLALLHHIHDHMPSKKLETLWLQLTLQCLKQINDNSRAMQTLGHKVKHRIKSLFIKKGIRKTLLCVSKKDRGDILLSAKDWLATAKVSWRTILRTLSILNAAQKKLFLGLIKNTLPNSIKTGRDLISALRHLSNKDCVALCKTLGSEKLNQLIEKDNCLLRLLEMISAAKCALICEHLSSTAVPSKDVDDFIRILDRLSLRKFRATTKLIKKALLPRLIANATTFSTLIHRFSSAKKELLLELVKNDLPGMTNSSEDFVCIMRCLYASDQLQYCLDVKNTLPSLICDSSEFRDAINSAATPIRNMIYLQMKSRLAGLIHNGRDLRNILTHLNDEQCKTLIDELSGKLQTIFKSSDEVASALLVVANQKKTLIFNAIRTLLPTLIRSPEQYKQVAEYLGADEKTQLFNLMKDQLCAAINSADDFATVKRVLSPSQNLTVFHNIKTQLFGEIDSIDQFCSALAVCPSNGYGENDTLGYRAQLGKRYFKKLPDMVNSIFDFEHVYHNHFGYTRDEVYRKLRPTLIKLITDKSDLEWTLVILDPRHMADLCKRMPRKLSKLIKTPKDLAQTLAFSSYKTQKCDILKALHLRLSKVVKNTDDIICILHALNFETLISHSAFPFMRKVILKTTKNANDLNNLIRSSSYRRCCGMDDVPNMLLDILKEKLPTLIQTEHDFIIAIQRTSVRKRLTLYDKTCNRFPNLLRNPNVVSALFSNLSISQTYIILDHVENKLVESIETLPELDKLLGLLTPRQQIRLSASWCTASNENFNAFFGNAMQYISSIPKIRRKTLEAIFNDVAKTVSLFKANYRPPQFHLRLFKYDVFYRFRGDDQTIYNKIMFNATHTSADHDFNQRVITTLSQMVNQVVAPATTLSRQSA